MFRHVFVKSYSKPDNKIVSEVKNRVLGGCKAEEDTNLCELRWQIITLIIKNQPITIKL